MKTIDVKNHIQEIAKMVAMDTVGSHRVKPELISFLNENIDLLNEIRFYQCTFLRYRNEDKYDELLDLVEDNNLV